VLTIAILVVGLNVIRRHPAIALALALVCLVGEIGLNTTRWYPRVKQDTAYPANEVVTLARQRGGRVIRVGAQAQFSAFAPDLATEYGVADAEGIVSLFPKQVDRYLRIVDDYGSYALSLNVAPPLSSGAELASPLLDALDVRTIVAAPSVPVPEGYARLSAGDPSVYARVSPGPALLVPDAEPVSSEQMWHRVASPSWQPTMTAAVVGLAHPVTGGPGTVANRGSGTDTDTWDVDGASGGFLRVSGNFDDGWSATLDGKSTKVYLADGLFRGVVVPPGRHLVRFSYRNHPEHDGRLLAGAALVAVVALCVPWPGKKQHPSNKLGDRRTGAHF
nr:YfhO family protein [Actinomycetota bacterium]